MLEKVRTLEYPKCNLPATLIMDGRDFKDTEECKPSITDLKDYKFDRAGVAQYYQCQKCLTIYGRYFEYLGAKTGQKMNLPHVSEAEYREMFRSELLPNNEIEAMNEKSKTFKKPIFFTRSWIREITSEPDPTVAKATTSYINYMKSSLVDNSPTQ